MSIILTKKQEEGLKIAIQRYIDGEKDMMEVLKV